MSAVEPVRDGEGADIVGPRNGTGNDKIGISHLYQQQTDDEKLPRPV